jgi:hypothetical protein
VEWKITWKSLLLGLRLVVLIAAAVPICILLSVGISSDYMEDVYQDFRGLFAAVAVGLTIHLAISKIWARRASH